MTSVRLEGDEVSPIAGVAGVNNHLGGALEMAAAGWPSSRCTRRLTAGVIAVGQIARHRESTRGPRTASVMRPPTPIRSAAGGACGPRRTSAR